MSLVENILKHSAPTNDLVSIYDMVYIYDAKDLELALQFEPWAKSIKVVSEHLVDVSASQMGNGKIQVIRISPNTHEFIRTSIDKENPDVIIFEKPVSRETIKNILTTMKENSLIVVNGLSSKEKYLLQWRSEDAYRAQDIFGIEETLLIKNEPFHDTKPYNLNPAHSNYEIAYFKQVPFANECNIIQPKNYSLEC